MYFAKFALLAASLVPAAVAVDLGTWDFYCGSSCSNGTLIASGDVNYGSFVECEGLAEAYEYCYLECCMLDLPSVAPTELGGAILHQSLAADT